MVESSQSSCSSRVGRGIIKSLISLIILLSIVGVVLAFVFGVVIIPGTMGVRQINFGPGQGVALSGLSPGLHWKFPFYTEIHVIPQSIQRLDFHRESDEGGAGFGPLEIRTSDPATIDLDVTVLYRFYSAPGSDEDGFVHTGPAELITAVGTDNSLWVNKVRRAADDALKQTLGQLQARQFYDPKLREEKVALALDYMNRGSKEPAIEGLAQHGIRAEAILLRRYTYRQEVIENAIYQKNLQDQEEALNIEEAKLSETRAKAGEEEAKGDQRNKTLVTEAEEKGKVIRSEADLLEAEARADGDLFLAQAKAAVDKVKAEALSKSVGSQLFVARELGPLLGSLKGGVVTDLDPYDLDGWLKRLGLNGNGTHEGGRGQ